MSGGTRTDAQEAQGRGLLGNPEGGQRRPQKNEDPALTGPAGLCLRVAYLRPAAQRLEHILSEYRSFGNTDVRPDYRVSVCTRQAPHLRTAGGRLTLDRLECGRRDSNSHGLPLAPLSQSAGDQRPAGPKPAAYAYSATPAPYAKVDAHGTIGHNEVAYSAVCKQGPGGGCASKTHPLRGLGLGGLIRLGLSHSGTSYPLPALRLTDSMAACASGPGTYTLPPSASRLEASYTFSRLKHSRASQ